MRATQSTAWKVKLGTGITDADGFRKAIKGAGMWIGDLANDILGKKEFTVAKEPTEVNLVFLSVEELGFSEGAMLRDIYQAAEKRGLELCPNEVGPQLRLQYRDNPKGEWIVIGMEPITDSGGFLRLFQVHGHDGQWLLNCDGRPDRICSSGRRFAFVLPSK